MRSWLRTAFVLFLLLAAATVFLALVYRPPEPGGIPEPPRVYHNLTLSVDGIDPETIHAPQGAVVILNLTSVGVEYRFSLPGYGISVIVPANETVSVVPFLAVRVGTFDFESAEVGSAPISHFGKLVVGG